MKNSAPGLLLYWNKSLGTISVRNKEIIHMNMIMRMLLVIILETHQDHID